MFCEGSPQATMQTTRTSFRGNTKSHIHGLDSCHTVEQIPECHGWIVPIREFTLREQPAQAVEYNDV
jgi:hypothetical protein